MLRRLWERWKVLAHVIGNFQSRLLLLMFYFLLLSPFALGVRLFSDSLRLKQQRLSSWIPRQVEGGDAWEKARRQS